MQQASAWEQLLRGQVLAHGASQPGSLLLQQLVSPQTSPQPRRLLRRQLPLFPQPLLQPLLQQAPFGSELQPLPQAFPQLLPQPFPHPLPQPFPQPRRLQGRQLRFGLQPESQQGGLQQATCRW
jgi:hypothetical protein